MSKTELRFESYDRFKIRLTGVLAENIHVLAEIGLPRQNPLRIRHCSRREHACSRREHCADQKHIFLFNNKTNPIVNKTFPGLNTIKITHFNIIISYWNHQLITNSMVTTNQYVFNDKSMIKHKTTFKPEMKPFKTHF